MKQLLQAAKQVSYSFGNTSFEKRCELVRAVGKKLRTNIEQIVQENLKDLEKMENSDPLYDRLLLNADRIEDIAQACDEISTQQDVLGAVLENRTLESGVGLQKLTVPMGVIACIYEARPNVTVDIAALCIFTGNVAVLRGSSSAQNSNRVLVSLIHEVLEEAGLSTAIVSQFSTDRADTPTLFEATSEVDLLIPRGGQGLIDHVRKNALVPVIETGAGVCHTYVDETADIQMAVDIVVNAKMQRPSVCNALDSLIVHKEVATEFFEKLEHALGQKVKIFADKESLEKFSSSDYIIQANNDIWGEEFLGLEMSVKTVAHVEEAVDHINKYGSRHSEAIISTRSADVSYFLKTVDASSVYHNASTRFTDGGMFGLGAEIGISTQKLHARGPMGAEALVTYKYILQGEGQVRS